jgi:hypothetical protein
MTRLTLNRDDGTQTTGDLAACDVCGCMIFGPYWQAHVDWHRILRVIAKAANVPVEDE